MKILTASALALALAAGGGNALAQSATPVPYEAVDAMPLDATPLDTAGYPDDDGYRDDGGYRDDDGHYDYARVLRVVPVGASGAYRDDRYRAPACVTRNQPGGYYGDGGYRDYGEPRMRRNDGDRAAASILGSVIGAVIGSQVGGGSARYATTAIGSTVGAVAGQQVYENAQRARDGHVTVCEPSPVGGGYRGQASGPYEVTYEYAGRTYMTRTNYDPGNRIRVRVEVHAE